MDDNLRKSGIFKCLMVYKSLNNLAPDYMKNMFFFTKHIHTRQTRASVDNKLTFQIVIETLSHTLDWL